MHLLFLFLQAGQSAGSAVEVPDCRPQDSIAAQVSVSDEAGSSFGNVGETGADKLSTGDKKPKAQRKRELVN